MYVYTWVTIDRREKSVPFKLYELYWNPYDEHTRNVNWENRYQFSSSEFIVPAHHTNHETYKFVRYLIVCLALNTITVIRERYHQFLLYHFSIDKNININKWLNFIRKSQPKKVPLYTFARSTATTVTTQKNNHHNKRQANDKRIWNRSREFAGNAADRTDN